FVQPFPTGSGRWQVSGKAGGVQPRWRRDGKELFYMTPSGDMMAAEVLPGPVFQTAQKLFSTTVLSPSQAKSSYTFSSDGQKFLINNVIEDTWQISVVNHWPLLLKK